MRLGHHLLDLVTLVTLVVVATVVPGCTADNPAYFPNANPSDLGGTGLLPLFDSARLDVFQ